VRRAFTTEVVAFVAAENLGRRRVDDAGYDQA